MNLSATENTNDFEAEFGEARLDHAGFGEADFRFAAFSSSRHGGDLFNGADVVCSMFIVRRNFGSTDFWYRRDRSARKAGHRHVGTPAYRSIVDAGGAATDFDAILVDVLALPAAVLRRQGPGVDGVAADLQTLCRRRRGSDDRENLPRDVVVFDV